MKLPDMHRSDELPDWEMIPESEWNEYQRRAAETNGWDTPGNRKSLRGAVFTLAGLALLNTDNRYAALVGVGLIGEGRKDDLEDGKDADRTGTKSPRGAKFDAGLDTLLAVASAITLKRKEIMPKQEADALLAITGVKVAASAAGSLLGRKMQTSRAGKVGTFGHWSGIGTHAIGRVAELWDAEKQTDAIHNAASIVMKPSLGLGVVSAAGYLKDAFAPKMDVKELLRESLVEVISGDGGMQGLQ